MLSDGIEARSALRVLVGESRDLMSSSLSSPLLPIRREGGETNRGPRPALTAGGAGVEGTGEKEGGEGKEARGATLGMEAPGVRGQGALSTAMGLTATSTSGSSGLLFQGLHILLQAFPSAARVVYGYTCATL